MPVAITISKYLRGHTAGQAVAEVHGTTVRAALEDLFTQYPALWRCVFGGEDVEQVRRFMHVYCNGRGVRSSSELTRPVQDGDELILIPDVA
jgi:molybdopterin converting factor small subunit